jgi:DNA-binding NarL/FixJ family response regulator
VRGPWSWSAFPTPVAWPDGAEGRSAKQIAELLVISAKTVERHRANLLHKLGLKDRVELTRYAIRTGLIEP